MASDIESAIRQICEEKGLSYESVMETIEQALAAAYRKDYGNKMQNIEVEFDPASGSVVAFDVKTVVEDLPEEEIEKMRVAEAEAAEAEEAGFAARAAFKEEPKKEVTEGEEDEGPVFNPKTDIMLSDAMVLKMTAAIGDVLRTELPVATDFGRMAAMTAKQVITQKLREAEREIVYNEFKEHEGEVLIGTIQRREGRVVLVDLGRSVGVMIPEDQVTTERYNPGDRVKVYVREVSLGTRGPQILVSRSSVELVKALFDIEIPEVSENLVEIKAIAREGGNRTKVAVISHDDSVDPIGACIGQRGVRIQTIINELSGEKIDVVEWSEDVEEFITAALSPAKVGNIEMNEEERVAIVNVDQDQLSLAIGRGGQNVRLASKLVGWKLSVVGEGEDPRPIIAKPESGESEVVEEPKEETKESDDEEPTVSPESESVEEAVEAEAEEVVVEEEVGDELENEQAEDDEPVAEQEDPSGEVSDAIDAEESQGDSESDESASSDPESDQITEEESTEELAEAEAESEAEDEE
jgi:transcription termination/antitermination protein NusA